MIKNYIKIAIRSLYKNSLFSFINIVGLALGMSVCLVAILYIEDAYSYDTFHPFPNRTYRIISDVTGNNGINGRYATSPMPLAAELSEKYPFVQQTVRVCANINDEVIYEQKEIYLNGSFTEPSFFDIFGFALSEGNAKTALEKPYSIVLTEETATLLFNDEDALGKTLAFKNMDATFTVTGIIKDDHQKSHLNSAMYVSFSTIKSLERNGRSEALLNNWKNYGTASTYILLKPHAPVKLLKAALNKIAGANNKLFQINNIKEVKYDYQQLSAITPGEALIFGGNTVLLSSLWLIGGITFLILVLACFNYTNLSLARSLTRAKEVGIRKVMGGSRSQVFLQFIAEAVIIATLALLVSCVILQLLRNIDFVSNGFLHEVHIDVFTFVWFLLFALFTGVLAGGLPAWLLSSFKPVQVMKTVSSIRVFKSMGLRKGLIVIQFSVSLLFVIFFTTMYKQIEYLRSFSYGFNQENIINLPLPEKSRDVLKQEILKIPDVRKISSTSDILGFHATDHSSVRKDKTLENIGADSYFVDDLFVSNMGLTLLAGKDLPATSFSAERFVLLNETAVKNLQFENPVKAIGQMVWLSDSVAVQVLGVVKDFNYANPKHPIGNLLLRSDPKQYSYLNIKIAPQHSKAVTEQLELIWKKLYPAESFRYTFFDQELKEARSYSGDFSIVAFLAVMTIAIASMGLLGIVTYASEIRRKEVGIRKVMGAPVKNIVFLLSKDFMLLIFLAGIITLPIGYFTGNVFLNGFASRITLDWKILLMGLAFIVLIGLLTICSQTIRIALTNPVKSLRTE
jgi:putative ABC transport system permease protein